MKTENTLKCLYYKEKVVTTERNTETLHSDVGRTQINYRLRELVGEKRADLGLRMKDRRRSV